MKNMAKYSRTLVTGFLAMAALAGLWALCAQTGWRYDATTNKRHSLSEQTVSILSKLNEPMRATAFFLPAQPERTYIESLFTLFAETSSEFTFQIVDPDRSPLLSREMGVTMPGEVILQCGDRKESLNAPDEQTLLNGIIRVASAERYKVYFVGGHDELDPRGTETTGCSVLDKLLGDQGVSTAQLILASQNRVPADADAVLILGPRRDFLEPELEVLGRYLDGGGRLFYAVFAETETNLDDFIREKAGIKRGRGIILDQAGGVALGDVGFVLVQEYPPSPMTKDFTNTLTVYPTATGLFTEKGAAAKPMAVSGPGAWLESDMAALLAGKVEFNPKTDMVGPFSIGMYAEIAGQSGKDSRIVVMGDQDFLCDRYIATGGNADMAKNCVNWLLARGDLVTLGRPSAKVSLLFPQPGQGIMLFWVPILGVPGLVALIGLLKLLRRRKAAR